jgi:O-Antigen ligase
VSVPVAPPEQATAPRQARRPLPPLPTTPPPGPGARQGLWWTTLLVAGLACLVTFYATGGLNLATMTRTEMALTLASGAAVACALLWAPAGARLYGAWPVALLLAFTALTALSLVWSVQPDDSWRDAGRMLAYSAVFAAAVALVRLAPHRWPAILGGLALAAVLTCCFALLTQIFPGELVAPDPFARLQEPFGYWNAVGLSAAMGAICCLWLGARRTGHALLSALAYPALGVLLLTLLLAYSRGALAALAVGLVLWFVIVPLRLRSAALLIAAGVAAGAVAAWDFSQHGLSAEGVELAQRSAAGHQLGALVLAMVILLAIVGVAVGFRTGTRPPARPARVRAGAALLSAVVLAIVAFAGALAHSQRGLTGSISHAVNALTNPNARVPPNTAGRLTAVASVRARYWKEALQVFKAHPALGSGAEGFDTAHLRYMTAPLEVRHAHGFIVQTLADLGLAGLVLALALLATWMLAARRCTHPSRFRDRYGPERIGMLTMLCLVVVFGAHSLVDWTWYVPGDACVALLCAGWLAGRGPLLTTGPSAPAPPGGSARGTRPRMASRPGGPRVALAGAAIVAALLAMWSQWEPQRSEEASQHARALLASDPRAAQGAAETAVSRDPLSLEALVTLAAVQSAEGQSALARATLQRGVRLQPSNPKAWLELGRYDLTSTQRNPQAAMHELQAAIYLYPESIAPEELAPPHANPAAVEIYNLYIQALREPGQTRQGHTGERTAGASGGLSSASGSRAPATAAARREAPRRLALRSARSRTQRAAR